MSDWHMILVSLILVNLVITSASAVEASQLKLNQGAPSSLASEASDSDKMVQLFDKFLQNKKIIKQSRTPTQVGDITVSPPVTGIAYLDGRIYVSQKSNAIQVFDASSPTFNQINTIVVDDLRMAVDLAADPNRKLLFVADVNMRIWKIDPKVPSSAASFQTDGFTPVSISFCPQSRQLTVVMMGSRKLFVYDTSDDSDVQPTVVHLPETLNLKHAVQTSNGNYLVAHTGLSKSDILHDQVTEFSSLGRVVRRYGGRRGSGRGQLNQPLYLAVADDGSVMVADSLNGRVVRLSTTLEYVDTVVEGVAVSHLYLAEPQHQLIVGQKINVGVYQH